MAKKRIFLIESDCDGILAITNKIAYYGTSASFDRTGKNVVRRLVEYPPLDLVLLELTLSGGLTGYDFLAGIRAHPLLCHIPVVALSALDPQVEIPKAQAAGFNGFIGRPIAFEEFADCLLDILNRRQVWISDSQLAFGD